MQIKKIKLKLKEKTKNNKPRLAKFKHEVLKDDFKEASSQTNIYQNIINADSYAISEEFERDFRRYSNLKEAIL